MLYLQNKTQITNKSLFFNTLLTFYSQVYNAILKVERQGIPIFFVIAHTKT